jgi:hypothetical protein
MLDNILMCLLKLFEIFLELCSLGISFPDLALKIILILLDRIADLR